MTDHISNGFTRPSRGSSIGDRGLDNSSSLYASRPSSGSGSSVGSGTGPGSGPGGLGAIGVGLVGLSGGGGLPGGGGGFLVLSQN